MVQQPNPGLPRQSSAPRRVRLTCPCCGFRVADASPSSARSIRLEANPDSAADLYIKCGRCKAEIAARLV